MSHLPMQLPATLRLANLPERPRPLRSTVKPYLIARTSRLAEVLGVRSFVKLPCEEEDAKITGSTRSLDRRLLALNVRGTLRSTGFSSLSLVIDAKIA
jgi:hypothetical protein